MKIIYEHLPVEDIIRDATSKGQVCLSLELGLNLVAVLEMYDSSILLIYSRLNLFYLVSIV